MPNVYKKVRKFCSDKSITIAEFERMCKIGNGTIDDWEDGKSKPSIGSLLKMQEATGITVQEWIS